MARQCTTVQTYPDSELEFEAATNAGLPRLVFMLDEEEALPIPAARLLDASPQLREKQNAFRLRLRNTNIVVRKVASPEQLEVELLAALQDLDEGRPARSEPVLGRVFISYRRADTAPFAGRLYDHLVESFGVDHVLMDIDTIEPGIDFVGAIEQAVASCEVLLVLIGSLWLNDFSVEGHRRVDDPHDAVRMEIEAALRNQLYVIPVLVGGAKLPPSQELPGEIQSFARGQAVELSVGHFRNDAAGLISVLDDTLRTRTRQLQRARTFLVPRNLTFVSYSHEDQLWLDRLLVHLRPLERHGRLEIWNDRQIRAGDEWREEIKKAIQSCQAAVLLVSADFMASNFIYNDELTPLLDAAKKRGVRIISLLVSSSSYDDSNLSKFQAVNDISEPLDTLSKGQQEAYFVKVYKTVREALGPSK